ARRTAHRDAHRLPRLLPARPGRRLRHRRRRLTAAPHAPVTEDDGPGRGRGPRPGPYRSAARVAGGSVELLVLSRADRDVRLLFLRGKGDVVGAVRLAH